MTNITNTPAVQQDAPGQIQVGSRVFRRNQPHATGQVTELGRTSQVGRPFARVQWEAEARAQYGSALTPTVPLDRLVLATEENMAQALAQEASRRLANAKQTLELWHRWYGENPMAASEFLVSVPSRSWMAHTANVEFLVRERYLIPVATGSLVALRYSLSDKGRQLLGVPAGQGEAK